MATTMVAATIEMLNRIVRIYALNSQRYTPFSNHQILWFTCRVLFSTLPAAFHIIILFSLWTRAVLLCLIFSISFHGDNTRRRPKKRQTVYSNRYHFLKNESGESFFIAIFFFIFFLDSFGIVYFVYFFLLYLTRVLLLYLLSL